MDERKIIEKGTLFLKKHFIAIIIAEIIIGLISLICAENNVMKFDFYVTFFSHQLHY